MAEFSLALNEDQQQLKDWLHQFSKDVIRPAAEEWDEKEEFPWPVVQEAAKIGSTRWTSSQRHAGRPDRPHDADRHRRGLLGRRRHRLAIFVRLRSGHVGNGTPEQMIAVQRYGTPMT